LVISADGDLREEGCASIRRRAFLLETQNTMPHSAVRSILPRLPSLLLALPAVAQDRVVFETDFDSGAPPEFATTPPITPEFVQQFAGLGRAGFGFEGDFYRVPTGQQVVLSLANLPAHSTLSLDFLFAAIDSLDGTGSFPSGDFFRVAVDGVEVFRESFANATPTQVQSYVPAPGVELARHVDLGFSGPGGYYTDSAYDMSLEPRFRGITHSAATATITFEIEGPGVQPLTDESWAIDRLRVRVDAPTTYCSAKLNSLGCTPTIGDLNVASISSGEYAVTAHDILNQENGLLFWGYAAANAPYHGGVLCVAPPTIRTPVALSGGSAAPASDCTGSFRFDFTSAYLANSNLVAGSTIRCQWWSRDPNAVAFDSLSNAIETTFGP